MHLDILLQEVNRISGAHASLYQSLSLTDSRPGLPLDASAATCLVDLKRPNAGLICGGAKQEDVRGLLGRGAMLHCVSRRVPISCGIDRR